MATFTSTLPDDLLQRLADYAKKLSLPKNKLMENALNLYLDHLKRAEYVKSYRQAAQDENILMVAEESMDTFLKQIEDEAG